MRVPEANIDVFRVVLRKERNRNGVNVEKYLPLGISEYGLLVNVIAVNISGTLDGECVRGYLNWNI